MLLLYQPPGLMLLLLRTAAGHNLGLMLLLRTPAGQMLLQLRTPAGRNPGLAELLRTPAWRAPGVVRWLLLPFRVFRLCNLFCEHPLLLDEAAPQRICRDAGQSPSWEEAYMP